MATPVATGNEGAAPVIPARAYLPILILLGYTAFLITGFGTHLGGFQPVPVYIFFSLLLLTFQLTVSENRSVARIVYVLATSGFALIYAGERVLNTSTKNFTRSPYTYIIINLLLVAVFLLDAIDHRRAHPSGFDTAVSAQARTIPASENVPPLSYGAIATDFAGLAILFFIAAFVLDLLGPQNLLTRLGLGKIGQPYVGVDLNQTLGLHLNPPINLLQNLDSLVALGASAIALLFLGIVGALIIPGNQDAGEASGFGGSIGRILGLALREVWRSLRLVLGPLVWLIPAFSIAGFARQITTYLNFSSRNSQANILDLFNPLSATSRAHADQGFQTLGLGVLAVLVVVAAVAIIEENGRIIQRAIKIVLDTGRVLALTWAFFLYSLALLNAVVVLAGVTKVEPFQVGAPGLIALAIGVAFGLVASLRPPMQRIARTAPLRPQGT